MAFIILSLVVTCMNNNPYSFIPKILILDSNLQFHDIFTDIFVSNERSEQNETNCFSCDMHSAYSYKEMLDLTQNAYDDGVPFALLCAELSSFPEENCTNIINELWRKDSDLHLILYADSLPTEMFKQLEYPDQYTVLKKPFESLEIYQLANTLTYKREAKKLAQISQNQLGDLETLVTEKTREIRASEERYSLAAKSANDGLWDLDLATDEVYYSDRFREILKLKGNVPLQSMKEWYSYVHEEDKELLPELIEKHLDDQNEKIDLECRLITVNEEEIWVRIRGLAAYDSNHTPVRIVGYMSDITEQKSHDQALYQAAFHDELTGLANRALFMNRLEQVIARVKRLGENMAAIMFLDLNRFKSINDTLGHQIGDEVLKIVATVLKTHTRPTDTISRIGGDEFTVLLDPIESIEEAEQIASRILEQLNKAYDIREKDVYIGSSIGLSLIDDPNAEAQILLRNADLAMYQAKTNQKEGIEIFDQQKHNLLLDNMEIENDLRNAVKNDELLVYYQPIIDLKTGHVISFESLMRWRHPQRGFVSPGVFIPLAEELGLIGTVGLFTVESVCKQLRTWQAETEDCPNISVNVSVRQLMDNKMYAELHETLSALGDLTRFISVEVTETVIMQDPNTIIERLKELRSLKMKIYMDDFGTGYSSLSYLANFPLDIIKIDQAFVASILTDNKAERLVASIVRLAEDLGLKTVAEGVETEEQMQKLIDLNCNYGQGHYFAKAMNAQVAREIVYNNTKFDIAPSRQIAS